VRSGSTWLCTGFGDYDDDWKALLQSYRLSMARTGKAVANWLDSSISLTAVAYADFSAFAVAAGTQPNDEGCVRRTRANSSRIGRDSSGLEDLVLAGVEMSVEEEGSSSSYQVGSSSGPVNNQGCCIN
jgi:hypothetical protein